MITRNLRETIMQALFQHLVSFFTASFTANTQAGSAVLSNPSSTQGLYLGFPVSGGSIPAAAVIQSLTPLTLSLPATANAAGVALTSGFRTVGRRTLPWTEVAAQPALFVRHTEDHNEWPNTTTMLRRMMAEIWIYSNAGQDPTAVPETQLNNILDALDAAFAPDAPLQNQFTLGGLVYWCRLNGREDIGPGDLDGQSIAVCDVEILVP